jgi:hypothetical protein
MKKLFVAAAVFLLAGVAVAGALHVKSSLSCGVCPLTGEPIRCDLPCAPSEDCSDEAGTDAGTASSAATGAAVESAPAADSPCAKKAAKRRCCPSQEKAAAKQAEPVETPTQRP